MNLEDYRNIFIVVTLGLALVAAYPAVALVAPIENVSEPFSEFWLLGPNHVAEDYPFSVTAGETYNVFVDVANHMGDPEYYLVYVKFGNTSQINFSSSEPSSLQSLCEFRFFVDANDFYESPVSFGFQKLSLVNDVTMNASDVENSVLSIGEVVINGVVFPVDTSASWDAQNGGFFSRLSFELWRYDTVLESFMFHDRIVGLQLNMTGY